MSATIWHDLECGRYEQDLAIWSRLAREHVSSSDRLLDVGAGTGRVSLALASSGYQVVALDVDRELLLELEARASGLPIEAVCANACTFELPGHSFALIIVPMQTVQLLGGPARRLAFLERAQRHLCDHGRIAIAIAPAEDFHEFQWHEGDSSPLPDIAEIDGCSYFSQPTAVRRLADSFVLERRREAVDRSGSRVVSTDSTSLDIVSAADLQTEGTQVGLKPVSVIEVPPTDEHIGSQVVILGA